MAGLLDLTPIYSPEKEGIKSFLKDETKNSLTLNGMCKKIIDPEWQKDKNLGMSDWGAKMQSDAQIHYAAFDAWTSFMLGEHALSSI